MVVLAPILNTTTTKPINTHGRNGTNDKKRQFPYTYSVEAVQYQERKYYRYRGQRSLYRHIRPISSISSYLYTRSLS